LAVAGCFHAVDVGPPVEPLTASGEIGPRLRRLANFSFHLEYRTDRPFELGAEFDGRRDSSDRERWEGTWWRGGDRRGFTVVGDGPVQYELAATGWTQVPRGSESRIHEQLEAILRAPSLDFKGERGGLFRYEFEPKLPLLDPSGEKRIHGELELEKRTGLLRSVRCSEDDGPARWSLGLSRYNRSRPVEVPFVPELELVLASVNRVRREELGQAVRTLSARLDRLGRKHRLFRRRGSLVLQLEHPEPQAVQGLLLGSGRVELWSAEHAAAGDTAGDVWEVGGDASLRVRPFRRLGGNGDFAVSTRFDFLAEPTLVFDASGSGVLPDSELVALVFDERVLDLARAAGERVEFGSAGGREFVPALAVVAGLPATMPLAATQTRRLLP